MLAVLEDDGVVVGRRRDRGVERGIVAGAICLNRYLVSEKRANTAVWDREGNCRFSGVGVPDVARPTEEGISGIGDCRQRDSFANGKRPRVKRVGAGARDSDSRDGKKRENHQTTGEENARQIFLHVHLSSIISGRFQKNSSMGLTGQVTRLADTRWQTSTPKGSSDWYCIISAGFPQGSYIFAVE